MTVKFIAMAIIILCVIIALIIGYFFPEYKYKNNPMARIKIVARIRIGCFLTMLILALICIII